MHPDEKPDKDYKICGGSGAVPSLVEAAHSQIQTFSDWGAEVSCAADSNRVEILSDVPQPLLTSYAHHGTHARVFVQLRKLSHESAVHLMLEVDGARMPSTVVGSPPRSPPILKRSGYSCTLPSRAPVSPGNQTGCLLDWSGKSSLTPSSSVSWST